MFLVATAASTAVAQYTLTNLAYFNGTDGAQPERGVILSGSTLYGTTYEGGAYGNGDVFSLPTTGGTPTVLTSFNGTNQGSSPQGGLILSGSTLYGTTGSGSVYGTVFSLPTTGDTPTILTSFDSTNGSRPEAGVILSGGTLYGTTVFSGANGVGEVFSVPVTGGTPTVLASFDTSNGANP